VPESVTADLLATSLSEAALENRALLTPTLHNYRSVNDGEGMSISDHSPVFATFLLKLDGSSENAGAAAQPAVEETASTASSSHVAAAPGGEEQPAAHDDAQADAATATADSETTADAAAPARTLSGDVQFRLKNFRLVWGASVSATRVARAGVECALSVSFVSCALSRLHCPARSRWYSQHRSRLTTATASWLSRPTPRTAASRKLLTTPTSHT
jgi:hypothetical protein